jgi:hypothetical protein
MANPLPVFRGASAATYPFTMTVTFRTIVGRFQNGSEQRSIGNPGGLVQFEVPFANLSQTQKNALKAWLATAKGSFDTTGEITGPLGAGLGGLVTYFNLELDSDEFAASQNGPLVYSAPLKLSQSLTQNLLPGTPGAAFPTLANGAMSTLPYTQRQIWQTVKTRALGGAAYTTPEFGGGFAGYPTGALAGWVLDQRMLTDADAATLLAHFIANWGRGYSFAFVDEDSVTYSHANGNGSPHYSSDSLSFRYNGVNDTDVKIGIELTNN